jgi:hypothetical protein
VFRSWLVTVYSPRQVVLCATPHLSERVLSRLVATTVVVLGRAGRLGVDLDVRVWDLLCLGADGLVNLAGYVCDGDGADVGLVAGADGAVNGEQFGLGKELVLYETYVTLDVSSLVFVLTSLLTLVMYVVTGIVSVL